MGNPKVGSLFAGVGGFDLGFHRAGFDVAWCVEIDARARDILARHFPDARIYADIREVDAEELESVDVVCGGFPCQDLSMAGKRAGLAGNRSGLFYDAMRIVRSVRPRFAIVENVCGLLSSNDGHDFAAVLREMGEGWDCSEVGWRVLDSQYFGVPQRRRRVFIVGSRSIGCAEEILDIREGCGGNTPPREDEGKETPSDVLTCAGERVNSARMNALCATYHKCKSSEQTVDRGQLLLVPMESPAHSVFCDVYNHTISDTVSATLTARAGGSNTAGPKILDLRMGIRILTPLEAERLQGFPDGWTEGQPDAIRYTQLGNAVTVNVAEWLARRVRKCLSP